MTCLRCHVETTNISHRKGEALSGRLRLQAARERSRMRRDQQLEVEIWRCKPWNVGQVANRTKARKVRELPKPSA